MLPADLQRLHGNDPRYQTYLQWVAEGAQHPSWDAEAEAAAVAAGIPTHNWHLVDPSRTRETDWGSNEHFDFQGNPISVFNPNFWAYVQNWKTTHSPSGRMGTPAPPPPTRELNLGPEAAAASATPAGDPILATLGQRSGIDPADLRKGINTVSDIKQSGALTGMLKQVRQPPVVPLVTKKKPLAPWEQALFGRR